MLKDEIGKYYFDGNYNCAETIIRAGNDYYQLGLHDEGKLAEAAMQGTCDISEKVKKEIIGTIKEDIDHDQQCLDKINEAIFKLNEYKLR